MKFTQTKGSVCRICGRRFSVRHYENGKITILCDCGCLVIMNNGAWSFIDSKEYKQEYAHLRAAKREAHATLTIKGATTPEQSQRAAIKRSNNARGAK